MPAAVILQDVSAGGNIRIEKIQSIGAVYNLPAATPAFSYRGIAGVPPPTDQSAIQQRTQLVEAIYTKLTQPGINALALTGIGGMGKSTLAALLCHYTAAQSSSGKGFFQAPPLWLSIDQAATFADVIGTIFQLLDKPLSILDNLSPAGQVEALFTLLDTLALPRLIVLDQFDNLLDWATGRALPTQLGVSEWINALGSRPWISNGRLLLTSRPFPQGTQIILSPCFQEYAVGGLTTQEGLALLRLRGTQAAEADLQTAVNFCDGHPLSLVLLMALIRLYEIPLVDLLAEPTLWIGDIATNLLDAVFRRLTQEQQAVLRAISVYRTAVPVAALTPFLPGSSSQQILLSLKPLLVQQVIQPAENGRYQVHAVVTRYAQTHFVEGDWLANQQLLRAAHATAAHYYLEQAQVTVLPREQRRGVNDIQGIIEAVWHYMQAAQWQEAYALVEQEALLTDLSFWGGNILLLDLCRSLLSQTEWQPEPEQAIAIYFNLGSAYNNLGNTQQALEALQQALAICREVGDRNMEAATLSNLGDIHTDLGNTQQALEALQQALAICREIGDRAEEATILNNIGKVYYTLGNTLQALVCLQQASAIRQEIGDHVTGGVTLSNIGRVYADLGDTQQALWYYQQALAICRKVGDRRGEGGTLWNIGMLALDQHHYDFALAAFLLARQCFEETSSPWQNAVESWIDDLCRKIGKKRFAALQARVKPQAQQIFEQALRDRQTQHEEEE
jgi:tetratricopeptide (TPR) repeat protein